jgi:hypothetical protein
MCPFGPRELAVGAFAEVFKNLIQGVQGSVLEIASASRRALSHMADFGGGIGDLAQWSARRSDREPASRQATRGRGWPLQGPSRSGKRPLQDLAHDISCC